MTGDLIAALIGLIKKSDVGILCLVILPPYRRRFGSSLFELTAKVRSFAVTNQLGNLGQAVSWIGDHQMFCFFNAQFVNPLVEIHPFMVV